MLVILNFPGKKDAFEKVRHLIEKAREQRKIALLKSNSKATPRMRLTPLRLNQASAQRRGTILSYDMYFLCYALTNGNFAIDIRKVSQSVQGYDLQ